MTKTTAPTPERKADEVTYVRLPADAMAEVRRFAAAEDRTQASFIRAMFRRGLDAYKAQQAAAPH